jgi:hypothetical protein
MSTGTTTPPNAPAEGVTDARGAAIVGLNGADPERALESALPLLATRGDVPLLLETAKALVRVGLAGVAVTLLRSLGGADARLLGLADQLGRLPSGELDAKLLAERYASRRAMLAERSPEALAALPVHLPSGLRVFRSARGNPALLREGTDGRVEFVLPFEDQVSRAVAITLPALEANSSYGFLGLPSEALLARVLAERSPAGYVPTVDIIERDATLAAIWMALPNDSSWFAFERLMCFFGADAYADFQRYLLHHPWRAPATNTLTVRRVGTVIPPLDDEFYAPIKARFAAAHADRVRVVSERYDNRGPEYWRQRYANAWREGRPLRLVGFTSRFSTVMQHVVAGLAGAFERRGCIFDDVRQVCDWSPGVDVQGTLERSDYDGIVLVNHLRFEYGAALPANVPVVSWIQDYMEQLCSRNAGRSIGPLDLVLAHSPDVLAALYGYPIDRCIGTNNLTDAGVYSSEPMPEGELAPHRCDVSFVSHGSETPEELISMIAQGNPPIMRIFLESALARIRAALTVRPWIHAHGLVELMLAAESEVRVPGLTPEGRRAHIYPQVVRLYDRVFRQDAIAWAARWAESRGRRLRLYGFGWERHPQFARYASGQVAGGQPLRALYQASRISLQVNGHSSLHQRLLDGLAAGGFLLCRTNPADFVRSAYAGIAESIRTHGIRSLEELHARRGSDGALEAACATAERFAGVVIRPVGDPLRDAHIAITTTGNNIAELSTDVGLFEILRDLRLIPTRVAGDLPRFTDTCFDSEAALHAMLDRFVDDPAARESISAPMRASVMEHDTYDGMVERILRAFGAPPRSER